jgi:hypothetical protein
MWLQEEVIGWRNNLLFVQGASRPKSHAAVALNVHHHGTRIIEEAFSVILTIHPCAS